MNDVLIQTLDDTYFPNVGVVTYLRLRTPDYRPLGWRELWDALAEVYPDRWAVQLFPPEAQLIDEENIYHLWLYPQGWQPPPFMNLKTRFLRP